MVEGNDTKGQVKTKYAFLVEEKDSGTRIDVFLSKQDLPFSRSQMHRRIEEGEVSLGGKKVKPGHKVKAHEEIDFVPAPIRNTSDLAEPIPLEILFEDASLIVVNKPAGMVVHPAPGHETGTLVNALLYHCGPLPFPSYLEKKDNEEDEEEGSLPNTAKLAIGGEHRPGIVHRIDQGTSGLLVCAKEEQTLRGLQEQFQAHSIQREYLCLLEGVVPAEGTFATRYGRHPHDRKRFTSRAGGKHAVTHFQVVERFAGASLVKVRLETGRTHQIRVHFSEAGFPIVGDPLYGQPHKKERAPQLRALFECLGHQALHARLLGFVHPQTKQLLQFSKEPPDDFLKAVDSLRTHMQKERESHAKK